MRSVGGRQRRETTALLSYTTVAWRSSVMEQPASKRQRRESSPVIYCHDDCARHVTTGDGEAEHQESPARLAAIAAALQNYARRRDFAPASREALLRVHSARYLDAVSSIDARGRLSPMLRTRVLGESGVDAAAGATPVGPGSWTAATRGRRGALAAVRDATPGSRAFVLVRPPGHHAMREGYDVSAGGCGFCVLGNAAVAAAEALTSEETRVAVVDFDVHHGNGTEAWAVTKNSSASCTRRSTCARSIRRTARWISSLGRGGLRGTATTTCPDGVCTV